MVTDLQNLSLNIWLRWVDVHQRVKDTGMSVSQIHQRKFFEGLKKKILKKENISGLVLKAVGNLGMVGGRVGSEQDQNMLYEIRKENLTVYI